MGPKEENKNMGQQQKIQAEAKAEHSSAAQDGGRPSTAPHHMVAAASGDSHPVVMHHVAR